MKLFHVTSEDRAIAILEDGFALSYLRDSPERSWLAATVETARDTASAEGWVVVVEIPAEVAEDHRYRFEDDGSPYLDNYCVPWVVLNACRPFVALPLADLHDGG